MMVDGRVSTKLGEVDTINDHDHFLSNRSTQVLVETFLSDEAHLQSSLMVDGQIKKVGQRAGLLIRHL